MKCEKIRCNHRLMAQQSSFNVWQGHSTDWVEISSQPATGAWREVNNRDSYRAGARFPVFSAINRESYLAES